jgi:hypothetical protein
LRNAAADAVRVLKAACPVETPTTPLGRIEAMQARVAAILQALELLRAPVGQFYFSLTDAQKARFQVAASPALPADEAAGSAGGENELVPQICTDHPAGLSGQTVDRLEAAVRTTDAQRGALETLRAATARAAKVLRDACPAGAPATPPERLAAMQQRLGAMVEAANLVRPALQGLYDAMDDAQKGWFNAVGRPAGRPADRGSD